MTDCKQQLRDQVRHIANVLENPPLVDRDGNEVEYIESDCGAYITDGEFIAETDVELHDPDTDTLTLTDGRKFDCGEFWQCTGFSPDADTSFKDGWIVGGEEVELSPMSGYDYLTDVLDIEYRVGSDREYRSAEVLVAFGGPNVWIDTKRNVVKGAWWGDSTEAGYIDNMDLDAALEELFNC